MSNRKVEQAVANTKKWIASREGRTSLDDALRRARETTEKLKVDRRVEEKMLREPFTV